MTPEEMQEIKNYLNELYSLGEIISNRKLQTHIRRKAETRFIEVKKLVDLNSIVWLGQLIKMVEGEEEK